ncbi:MAG TPA: SRPBCC family protein [Acidimicrobiia bacterium]
MIELEVSVDIDAPIEEVFEFSTNNENDPTWMEEVTRVEKTSEGSVGVGSTFINYVEFMGKTFDDSHEVVEYEPNERMTIVQTTGPVPFKATYLYRSVNGGTRFSMQIEAETKGFFRVATPLVRRQLRRQFERNLRNLKSLLE